jgi:hypothetical protein
MQIRIPELNKIALDGSGTGHTRLATQPGEFDLVDGPGFSTVN